MNHDEFYVQDGRGYVGNDMLWWRKGGAGYTTNIAEAHVFTKEEALRQHQTRETDIPWPKEYVDQRTSKVVDMQDVNRKEALAGTGIKLQKRRRPRKSVFRCGGCGRFLKELDQYLPGCPHCGQDNRP